MRLLAVDPGGTTGWAYFVDNKLDSFGSVDARTILDPFHEWLTLWPPVDIVIVESYIINTNTKGGFQHRFDKGETLQRIGAIKYEAYLMNVPCIEQPRTIKVPAAGMVTGKPYKDNQKEKQHYYDAMLHGGYYLMTKHKVRREDFASEKI